MGNPLSCLVAKLFFMCYFEIDAKEQLMYLNFRDVGWLRYFDDIFAIFINNKIHMIF